MRTPRPNPAFNTDAPWAALRAGQRVAGYLVSLGPVRSLAAFALLLLVWLLASCATSPAPTKEANWLDEKAFRSCLGIKVPIEMIRDRNVQKGSISLEIDVLPSGKIESVSVISGSGNAALDEYLVGRLNNLRCAPFASIESPEPYSVNLELNIQVEK